MIAAAGGQDEFRNKVLIGLSLGLFILGFVVGSSNAMAVAGWLAGPASMRLVAISVAEPFLLDIRVGFFTALLFAAGPVACLISRRGSHLAWSALGFAVFAVGTTACMGWWYRARAFYYAAVLAKVSPADFKGVYTLGALPVMSVFLPGLIVTLAAALVVRARTQQPV